MSTDMQRILSRKKICEEEDSVAMVTAHGKRSRANLQWWVSLQFSLLEFPVLARACSCLPQS